MNNPSVNVGAMYSTLCSEELLTKITPMFDISTPISCEFIRQGVNDSYKVMTKSDSYLLRIYRKDWRTKSDIEFELSVLSHLHQEKVNVAYPIATVTGENIISINTPEGERFSVMTSFAAGKSLSYDDVSDSALYAEAVAKIHKHSDNFISQHERYKIDLDHLIEEPLQLIKPYLKDRDSDWDFLKGYASKLSINVANSQSKLDIGFCHGDFHTGNAYEYNGDVCFYDFDCCGMGYRAYDLAVYKWGAKLRDKDDKKDMWLPFINAYQKIRDIPDEDLTLVDDFVSIRHIWFMGLQTGVSIEKGWFNDEYFTRQLKFLRDECEERNLDI